MLQRLENGLVIGEGDIDYVTFDDDLGFRRRFRDIWTHGEGDSR